MLCNLLMDVWTLAEYTPLIMFSLTLPLVILSTLIIEVLVLSGQNRKYVGAVIPVNVTG